MALELSAYRFLLCSEFDCECASIWNVSAFHFTEHDLAILIGKHYMHTTLPPETKSELISWLQTRIGAVSGADGSVYQKIDTSIRGDFSNDKIAIIQGWWLSETEVRMCALAAVTATEICEVRI